MPFLLTCNRLDRDLFTSQCPVQVPLRGIAIPGVRVVIEEAVSDLNLCAEERFHNFGVLHVKAGIAIVAADRKNRPLGTFKDCLQQ